MAEFPDATSFLVLLRFSWKLKCSWFFSAARSLLVLSSNIASFCHTRELDAASWLCSLAWSLRVLVQTSWQGALGIPVLFDAIGLCTVEELVAACVTRFNVGFDFATILSSPLSSCILFAIVSRQLVELKFWEQQIKLFWLMLNKWRRWFQSSRVTLPLVRMSASWCLVSTYLIWILGSRLILSNKLCGASHQIEKTSRSTKHDQHYTIQECRAWLESWFVSGCACLMGCYATSFPVLYLWISSVGLAKNGTLQ